MKIIIPLVCTLFLLGCNDTKSTEKASAVQNTNAIAQEVNLTSALQEIDVAQPKVVASIETDTVVKTEVKTVSIVKEEVKKPSVSKEVKEIKPQAVKEKHTEVDSSALYGAKCASCHGSKGEKPALGKSQVIAGWTASKIEDALKGYQAGSYGKEMKAVMQGQTKSLSAEEIQSLSKYISTL